MAKMITLFFVAFVLTGSVVVAQSTDKRSAEKIITRALIHADTVTMLDLSGMEMDTLPDDIAKLKNLKILYLDENNFRTIPQVVFKLKNLEVLSMRGWGTFDDDTNHHLLTIVPSQIDKLTSLVELNLEKNNITDVPQEFAQLKSLRRLFLYGNGLSAAAVGGISRLYMLEVLDLSANNITGLPASFSNLKNLKYLGLDNEWEEGCPVGDAMGFPNVLCSLTNLEVLSMQGQSIDSVPASIGNLKKLRMLDLYGNQFLYLPESIGNLTELTSLNIGLLCLGNMLKLCDLQFYFPQSICNLQKLKSFFFEGRSIAPKEMDRIKECLPKNLFKTEE